MIRAREPPFAIVSVPGRDPGRERGRRGREEALLGHAELREARDGARRDRGGLVPLGLREALECWYLGPRAPMLSARPLLLTSAEHFVTSSHCSMKTHRSTQMRDNS